jgi:hypothetical protein
MSTRILPETKRPELAVVHPFRVPAESKGSTSDPHTLYRKVVYGASGTDHDLFDRIVFVVQSTKARVVRFGLHAMLWVLGSIKRSAQHVGQFVYAELCPSYLETIDGVTRHGALSAWSMLRGIIGWWSIDYKRALAMGIQIRELQDDQRWGQHLLIPEDAWRQVMLAYDFLRSEWQAPSRPDQDQDLIDYEITLTRLPIPDGGGKRGRTVAVRCPCGHHSHGDRNPSLVLWSHGKTGGARCMVSNTRYRVRYDGNRALLTEHNSAHRTGVIPRNLHNRNPGATRLGFGSCVTSWLDSGKGRTIGARAHDLMTALRNADKRSDGPSATTRARDLEGIMRGATREELDAVVKTPLIAASQMAVDVWDERSFGTIPAHWVPTGQRWVLWDIDNTESDADVEALRRSVSAFACRSRETTGKAACVRTSPHGVQLWVELTKTYEPRSFFGSDKWVRWYGRMGAEWCRVLGSGEVDWSAFAPGRWGRRPGWRLLDDGTAYRAHVVFAGDANESAM